MASGFNDITHIAGLVFIKRGFVDEAAKDRKAIYAECAFDDLSDDQLATFEACIHHPRLREIIAQWWAAYDAARDAGEIPQVKNYWMP